MTSHMPSKLHPKLSKLNSLRSFLLAKPSLPKTACSVITSLQPDVMTLALAHVREAETSSAGSQLINLRLVAAT
jgi:hypothetical protein